MIYKTNVVVKDVNHIPFTIIDAQIDCHIGESFGAEFWVWDYNDYLAIVGKIVDIRTYVSKKTIAKTIYLELDSHQLDELTRAIAFKKEALELEKREIILC